MAVLVAGVLVAASCDDTPTDFETRDTDRLEVNPGFMVLPAGQTAELDVRAVNAGKEPTFAAVTATVADCGPGAITVADDPDQLDIQPPGQLLVTAGNTIGPNCISLSADGVADTVDVIVVGDALVTVSVEPSVLRASETGLFTVDLVASDGSSVTPFDVSDVVFTTDSSLIATVDPTGAYSTAQSGFAVLTATWTGTAATGTDGTGVSLEAIGPIEVQPNVPVSVAFAVPPADTVTGIVSLGGAAGRVFPVEVLVLDAFGLPAGFVFDPELFPNGCPACPLGNQNTNPDEVLGVTAVSSNPAAVTVVASLDSTIDPFTEEVTAVNANLTIELIAAGAAEITGTVTTTEGVFPFGPIFAFTFDPIITSVGTGSGSFAEIVTITGTGLGQAGFETTVRADSLLLGNYTVVSPTEITAQMPTYSAPETFAITVEIGGVISAPVDWNMAVGFVESATEDNDPIAGGTPGDVSLPLDITGSMTGEAIDPAIFGSPVDWLLFQLSETREVRIVFDWVDGDDKDVYVVDEAIFDFMCNFAGATGAKPEDITCTLAGPGVDVYDTPDTPDPPSGVISTGGHHVIPVDFDEAGGEYTLIVTVEEEE
jgi:hypothetical protein